jgi:hypothetical protein
MPSRILDLLFAVASLVIALALGLPAVATVMTPGWVESARVANWAAFLLFLTGTTAFLFLAWRFAIKGLRPADALLAATDWWFLTTLAVLATICVGLASNWGIALPGLLVIGLLMLLGTRRAKRERAHVAAPRTGQEPPNLIS